MNESAGHSEFVNEKESVNEWMRVSECVNKSRE